MLLKLSSGKKQEYIVVKIECLAERIIDEI